MDKISRDVSMPPQERALLAAKEKYGNPEEAGTKFEQAVTKLKKMLEVGEIKKTDGKMGEVAFKFMSFVHEQGSNVGGPKIDVLFEEFDKKNNVAYEKELIKFLAGQFEQSETIQ